MRCASLFAAFLSAILLGAISDVRAQFTFASDNASNYGGSWANGSDQGTGFGGWGLSAGASSGGFIGNPSTDGMGTTGIGTTAFGSYSTGTGYFNASRGFDVGMGIGDSFTFYWAINYDAGGGSKGFDLKSGGATIFNVNNTGSATITAGGVNANTSYGTSPMLVTLTRTGTGTYSFSMTSRSGGATYSTNISTSSTIDGVNFYIGNQNDGAGQKNMYFNAFAITNSGVFSSGGTVTNANTFSGSGALSIGGSTTLILSGAGNNNYSGATTISNGSTLVFAGSGTSQSASTIGGTGGNLTVSNSSGTLVLTNNNSYTGNTTVAAGTLLIAHSNALGSTGSVSVNAGGRLQLSNGITFTRGIVLTNDGISGSGALQSVSGNNTWSGNITNNGGSAGGARINADSGSTLTIGGNITSGANSLYLGGAGNTTVNGTISGSATTGNGALYKDGAGILTLSANNSSLTGLVRLLGGTISITNANSLGSGTLELGATGTQGILLVNSNTTRSGNLLITDSTTNSVVNVAAGQSFTNTGSLTQSGNNSTTKFGKSGSGTLILAGASGNIYNGQIQIGDGTVVAGSSTALGTNTSTVNRGIDLGLNIGDTSQANNVALLASNGVTVSNSFYVSPNTSSALRTIGLAGSGAATFNNQFYLDGTLTVDGGSSATDLVTVSGSIINTGGLSKIGPGTVILSGANTFTGNVDIKAGRLNLSGGSAISDSAAVTVSNGATLGVNTLEEIGSLSGEGDVSLGAMLLAGGNNASTTLSGAMRNGGGFVKKGTGTLTLSGASTATGETFVTAGTLLFVTNQGGTFTNNINIGETNGSAGAVLSLSNGMTLANPVVVRAGSSNNTLTIQSLSTSATNTISGPLTLSRNATVDAAGGGTLLLSGSVGGVGLLVKTNVGMLALTASNNFIGGVQLEGGTVLVGNNNALGTGTLQIQFDVAGTKTVASADSSSAYSLANNINIYNDFTIGRTGAGTGSLTFSGAVALGNPVGATSNRVVTVNGSHTMSGVISGQNGMTKNGIGTLTLSGASANTFSGRTTISGGVLNLGKSSGEALVGPITINNGAKLLLSSGGQVGDTSAVTLSGGTIARGGNVTEVFGNLNLTTSSFLDYGAANDVGTLRFGTYTPSALLTVQNFLPGSKLQFGNTISSSDLNNASLFAFSSNFTTGTEGGFFTITAIPEPSAYLAAAGLLAMLLWPSRRRLLKDTKSILGLRIPARDRLARH